LPSVLTRLWLVHVLAEQGEFADGVARGQEGLEIAETVNQPINLIAAYRGLGYLYLRKGDLDEAIRFLERSRELTRESGIPGYISGIIAYLGYAYVLSGRLTHGLSLFEQWLEHWIKEFGSLRGSSGFAWSLATLAEAYGLANRQEDAIRTIEQ